MSNNNNQINILQAREAMDRFTMLISQEVGVNLTSRKAGSAGAR